MPSGASNQYKKGTGGGAPGYSKQNQQLVNYNQNLKV